MSALQSLCVTLCYTCVAVGVVSLLTPQKRTRRVMGFVIGLFFISSIASAVAAHTDEIAVEEPEVSEIVAPTYCEEDYQRQVAQMTADNLTEA